jgi:tripartite-type tricarboxylate transporter receptor subunit TctC
MIFVTSPDSSFTTGEAFVQAARQNPGKYSVGTPGPTSPKSVVLDALADEYGVKLNAVPLQGQAGVVAAILGKNVDVAAVEATDDVRQLITAGKVVPLAAIASERVAGLDETPTLAELGLPKASLVDNVYPFFGPKGLPENVVSRLEGGVRNCLADPGVIDKIGKDYVSEPFQGAAATTKFMTDSANLYHGIVSG